MAKKKDYKNKVKQSGVEEPSVTYNTATSLQFFTSFEEMNAASAREMAAYTPLQRLQHVTEYLTNLYVDDLKEKNDLTIYYK